MLKVTLTKNFGQPHVVPNLYDFPSLVDVKKNLLVALF